MLSKIKSCFFNLPIIRKWKHKRDQLNIKRGIETLNGLKHLITHGVYAPKEIIFLHAVLSKLTIESKTIDQLDQYRLVNLYSKSSNIALEFIGKKYFDKETITRRRGEINLKLIEKPINCWMSNPESVHYFIVFIKEAIRQNVLLETVPKDASPPIEINGEIQEFINSMLFRLLLTDFLEIAVLILEINYETNERKI